MSNTLNTMDDKTLEDRITKWFVKIDGSNVTEDDVTNMLNKLPQDNQVIRTKELPAKVAEPGVVTALVPALAKGVDNEGIYTKKGVDDAFVRNDGSNVTEDGAKAILGKLTGNEAVVKIDGSNVTEDGAKAILGKLTGNEAVVKIDGSNVTEDGAKAILGKLTGNEAVAKIDGSNVTEDGAKAILGKLTGNEAVAKIDGSNVTEDGAKAILGKLTGNEAVAKIDGSNVTEDGVTNMLSKLPQDNQVIRTKELPAKVAEPGVVTALVPALAKGVDNKGIYTKKGVDDAFVRNDGSNAGAIVTALTEDQNFINAAKIQANAEDAGFQSAVRGVISQPYFDIPEDDSTPISAYW